MEQFLTEVGKYTGPDALESAIAREGFSATRARMTESRMGRVRMAAKLMADVASGKEDPFLLREAFAPRHEYAVQALRERYPGMLRLNETMSFSDFSALTVDVLDRMLYGYYSAAPVSNLPLVKTRPLRDFRIVKRFAMDGATTPFVAHQPGEPPKERSMTQNQDNSGDPWTYQPTLYQGMMSVNWRALINDDLGIFNDQVQRLAISARRTLYKGITALYVDANGPHASLYKAGFSNLITTTYGAASNNPPLSFQGLIDAITVLEKQLDTDGQPITFDGQLYLWYGPSLHTTAMALLKAINADISVGGGTTNAQGFPSQRLRVDTSYVVQNMQPIQDKYIPIVCTTSGVKSTMWGLTYAPSAQARPSVELGQLNGFETPQLFQRVPTTMRVGGGVDPTLGSFETMDQDYKAIIVFGGTQIDGRSTVASTGQGT